MLIKIEIFDYKEHKVLRNLVDDLKNKNSIIDKQNDWHIDLSLNVNSFDEIIPFLQKYNQEIEIDLRCYKKEDVVRLFISKRYDEGLGNQVE